MENSIFHRLSSILWRVLVVLVVLLAVYVSVGRMLTVNLTPWRTAILQELNARVPFTVAAEQVAGQWQFFAPVIVLKGIQITFPGSSDAPLELSSGSIGLDVLNSLRTASLQLTRLELTELTLHGLLSREGKLQLTGFGAESGGVGAQLQEFLLNVEQVTLTDNLLKLTLPNGDVRDLDLDLLLVRTGSDRHVEADLTSTTGTRIAIIAQGIGDPFRPELFSGQAFLEVHSPDLGAARALLSDQNLPVWVEGVLDSQLWLDWDRGQSSLAVQLVGHDLLISGLEEDTDSTWAVPLDRVALQARLQSAQDQWTVFAQEIVVEKGAQSFTLPRLQLEAMADNLQIRAQGIPLEPLNSILKDVEGLSPGLHETLSALHPRGDVVTLQARTANINVPAEGWEIEANFENLALDPFKGAPGLKSLSGYTKLTPAGGSVLLDSQLPIVDFPAVFSAPLHFQELYGSLQVDWDADTEQMVSGVLTTDGDEGVAKVLFALTTPELPAEAGIYMDLLVGLRETHPVHRVKYIPYTLDSGLQTWLSDSIGDGLIEQGAFIWRGSLRQGEAPLRTVQLAFNVANTQLSYHPDWPPVLVEKGTVLIDDSAVSVWAESARLFESAVEELSVETRMSESGQLTASIDASVIGNAADGLKVLNDSPLAGIIGPTFSAWSMDGELTTDFQLELNLSDKSVAPQVEVATRWDDVDLLITPGNLPIEAVSGEFNYSTRTGFSSRSLAGQLWGNTVNAELHQQHAPESGVYDPASSALDIQLASSVDMADVRDWLALKPLAFVSGQTTAEVGIQLVPGKPPLLLLDSELAGVSIDLPSPWQKASDQLRDMHLELPLVADSMLLSVDLAQQLQLKLDFAEGSMRGGALGFNTAPPMPEPGQLLVTGHAPLIQGDEWAAFVSTYFSDTALAEQDSTEEATHVPEAEVRDAVLPVPPIDIVIAGVRADTLVVFEQEFQDVQFSAALDKSGASLSLMTDWLRGDLSLNDVGTSQADIQHLDLERLSELQLAGSAPTDAPATSSTATTLPDFAPVAISLSNLFQGARRLGELDFELQGSEGNLIAQNITGELAHLRLSAAQPARLIWHQDSDSYSELQARLEFGDLGQTLEYFGYERMVETEEGEFDLNLTWPGAPHSLSMPALQGSMQVAIGAGSFPEAPSGAAGALRVVSVLNLADIVQRLSLSDTFESGIPFYTVDGEIYFHSGVLEVARMDVQGGSSFQFSGVSDLQAQSLDGELVATLPVARNLPWIAALAASLPVAAGVFVVSRIFDKQMNRLSSAVYSIEGSWNDPQVSFEHIFDDTESPSPKNDAAGKTSTQSASP